MRKATAFRGRSEQDRSALCPACSSLILETFRWNVFNGIYLDINRGHGTTCPYNENKTSCQIRSVESAFSGNIVSRLFCFWLLIFGYWDFLICFVGTRRAVSANPEKGITRWKHSTGMFPKLQHSKRDTRTERSCSLRPRKAVAFLTHLLRAPKSKGAGSFAVCGQRLRGHVPSKNTSPAALSWSSLTSPTTPFLFASA